MVLNNKKQYVGNLMKWHLERRLKSKVLERRNCFVYFCDYFGKYDIHRVTEDELKQWFKELKKRHGYTKSTMRNVRASINHFFEHLVEENIISINPLLGVKFRGNSKKTRERTVLSPIELDTALTGMKEMSPSVLHPFIFVLSQTGARLDEIRTLKWRHINFDGNHIYVPHTKNGYERRIPMTDKLSKFLMELKDKIGHKSEYLFLNQWGTLLSKGQIRDMVIKYQKISRCTKRWTPHDLRHSFAHNYLKKGGQMYALQALLGHRSITMTINYYGQIKATDVEMVNPYE